MGKSISKAFKKITKIATDPLKILGGDDAPKPAAEVAPAPEVQVAKDTPDEDVTQTTESDMKKTKRVGKSQLSVSRSSGGGISI